MGSIPIYWGEAPDMAGLLGAEADPHWARAVLERDYRLRPIDTLEPASLGGLKFLLVAQPRALAPAENVALDAWVRAGGRLLLFADPHMTGGSRFALGDRRRPLDTVLLSPILAHWGLVLHEDESEEGPALRDIAGTPVPVDAPGGFALSGAEPGCTLLGRGLMARCGLGEGHATVLADAAVLDLHAPHPQAPPALEALVRGAFGESRENAGESPSGAPNPPESRLPGPAERASPADEPPRGPPG